MLWAERKWTLKRGQTAALYVSTYTLGRFWFEQLRIDHAHIVAGLRVNSWTEIAECIGGLVWFWWLTRHSTVDSGKYPNRGITPASSSPAST